MSSTQPLKVMRCMARYAVLTGRGTPETSGKVCRAACVRWTSSSARFGSDSTGRPVTWESFGIWDNRLEEPIILPSSIRYGKQIPQVSLSKVGSSSVIGLRNQNEDRVRVARIHDNLLYFAVFDGHGGLHAADYCYNFMEKHIRDALEEEDDLEKVLTKAFLDTDSTLRTHLRFFQSGHTSTASLLNAGTTATVAMLRDGAELVVGSVGDSRALLCRDGKAYKLTSDHTPDRKDEMKRIGQHGGFITWNSVGQANVNGKLAMTRSIGDFHLRSSGVIAEPETIRLTVKHASDSFLALTTDGIHFLLSDQEICDVINHCHDPTEAAEVLSQQALQYGSEDNTSAIVVSLGAWGRQMSPVSLYSVSRNFASTGRWA